MQCVFNCDKIDFSCLEEIANAEEVWTASDKYDLKWCEKNAKKTIKKVLILLEKYKKENKKYTRPQFEYSDSDSDSN